jgi:hypothetical protein
MTKSNMDSPKISRREFTRRAGMAAASAVCLSEAIAARPSTLGPQPLQQTATKLSPESQAEADEKVQAIFRKYGARLSENQKDEIRRLVTEGQKPLDAMRKFPLENSDQPANVMKLFPDTPPVQRTRGV